MTDSEFFYNLANSASRHAEKMEQHERESWSQDAWKRHDEYVAMGDAYRALGM